MTNVRGDGSHLRMIGPGLSLTPVTIESECLSLVTVSVLSLLGLWRIRGEVKQIIKVDRSYIHPWLSTSTTEICFKINLSVTSECHSPLYWHSYTEWSPTWRNIPIFLNKMFLLMLWSVLQSSALCKLRLTAAPRYTTGLCVITPTHTSTSCSSGFYCALCSLPNECIFNPEHS